MIDVLKLHDSETDDIETGEVLNLAENIYVQRKINDMSVLEFDYPMDDKARLITEGKICSSGGQRYEVLRIKRSMSKTDMLHVSCRDLFSCRAKDKFIPTVADKIGVKIKDLLNYVRTTYASNFSFYSDAELAEMGMEWVSDDYKIDFFTVDKTNLWDLIHTVIDNLGRGEIYSDGYKFAIVEKIGQDRGVRLTLHKNMENIDVEKTTEEIITRLWAFGADDMPITSVNSGKAYIDSPNIDRYGIHEGYRDYSDYTDASKILANAQWEFDANNEDRIDIPQITITGKVIDLSKLKEYGELEKIELGDTVHVIDNDGTEYTERVIEGVWYPYEAKQTTLSIGHMRRDLFFTLYQLQHGKMDLEAVQTTGKQLRTRSLAGVVNSDRNNVQSDNELLKIVGDLLTIEDRNRIRIRLGNYKGEFVFIIYDTKGG
ncbi:MAG: phage tail protein, partial [Clostridia bacterium]|nr:phage tail protein [Clostridia bacterium]